MMTRVDEAINIEYGNFEKQGQGNLKILHNGNFTVF